MKKYKLIKKYPGFSELGTIIECQDGTSYYSKNPEYWEEVLAPDYEILVRKLVNENSLIHSVKRLSDGEVFTIGDTFKPYGYSSDKILTKIILIDDNSSFKQGIWFRYKGGSQHFTKSIKVINKKDYEVYQVLYATEVRTLYDGLYRLFTDGVGFDLDYILNNAGYIHSVKRLSDGEIFSRNDMVNIGKDHQIMIRTISRIKIDTNGELIILHENGTLTNNKLSGIFNRIKRVPFYDIISYVHKGRPNCITTKKRGGQRHDEFWNIHSIKRLSDDEVFTIGDQVQFSQYYKGKILGIKTSEKNAGRLCFSTNNPHIIGGWFNVNDIKKIKPVLYRTEDGVDIHLGDETWGLHKNSFYLSPKPTKNNNPNWVQVGEPAHWVFSTEEAAKEYQLRYAPCLSLDDIRRAIYLSATSLERLLATAKSKL